MFYKVRWSHWTRGGPLKSSNQFFIKNHYSEPFSRPPRVQSDHLALLNSENFDPLGGLEGQKWPGINILGNIYDIDTHLCTLRFQIDNTVRKKFTRLENNIKVVGRATGLCPSIKGIKIWLSARVNLKLAKCYCYFPAV